MNKKQKIVLWAGIAVFVLVGLNPRWKTVSYGTGKYIEPKSVYVPKDPNNRFADLLNQPTEIRITKTNFYWGPKNTGRLFCYWTMIAVVTGGLLVTLKDKKPKDEQKQ